MGEEMNRESFDYIQTGILKCPFVANDKSFYPNKMVGQRPTICWFEIFIGIIVILE